MTLAAIALLAMLVIAPEADAATIGPLELTGASPLIQVPTLLGLHQQIVHGSSAAAYGSGGRGAPASTSELTITKKFDETSAALAKAAAKGTHYAKGSLILQSNNGSYEAICMIDVFVTSVQVGGASGGSAVPDETVGLGYAKASYHYGQGVGCGGTSAPPVESTLVGINRSASKLTTRLDCLKQKCGGIIAVSLPRAACPARASAATSSNCSFTGPVRVGLNGGKVKFNGDGTAFTGGVKIGIGGAGKFSMGDGSVRVMQLAVPPPLRKWLKGHSHGKLGSIIVVRGLGKSIVEREALGAPAKIQAAIPDVTASEPNPPPPTPGLAPQSLLVTECSTPVVGTPTMVTVSGSLSPPRAGATVTLTYTPVNGPPPLPAPVIDQVTTTATGNFSESFDRQREGKSYSWNVVASIGDGEGYAATSSAACAIPIP